MTKTIFINLCSLFPRRLHFKLALTGKAVPKRCLKIIVIYMYIAPGHGQTTPWSHFFLCKIINLLSIWPFVARCLKVVDGWRWTARRQSMPIISSPCEPSGSGELKISHFFHLKIVIFTTFIYSILHRRVKVMDSFLFLYLTVQDEPRHEKTNILVSDQVGHKPGCAITEYG